MSDELPTTNVVRPRGPQSPAERTPRPRSDSKQPSLDCQFPRIGETLGEFYIMAELGRGATGRAFLAMQTTLNNRPVVLKMAPPDRQEHLALARLQHTHIMPLLFAQEFPERNLRALCEPYLGTTTLAQLLQAMKTKPVDQRTGRDMLEALDQAAQAGPVALTARGPGRDILEQATYVEAICWLAVHLADALHYAHERGLAHLDLKPANILIAVDGQPLILDFDMARGALDEGAEAPSWLGGTPGYIAPEQRAALAAVPNKAPLVAALDGRADIYSLGMVLCEALGGNIAAGDNAAATLPSDTSVGLADIVRHCLQPIPAHRFATADRMAEDLRRHLRNQPLRWTGNRSPRERWQKWRRRRPYHLPLYVMLAAVLCTGLAAFWVEWQRLGQQRRDAEQALFAGQEQLAHRQFADAERTLTRGRDLALLLPDDAPLLDALEHRLRLARRGQKALDLRAVVEQLHFFTIDPALTPRPNIIDAGCRNLWKERSALISDRSRGLDAEVEQDMAADFRDMAILWPALKLQLAPGQEKAVRSEAMTDLDAAEKLFGPSQALCLERKEHARALGWGKRADDWEAEAARHPPRDGWDHRALGRHYLLEGNWQRADHHLQQACNLQPRSFLAYLYAGVSAQRQQRFADAIVAYSVCVGQAPRPESYYFRALAFAGAGKVEAALSDLKQVLALRPDMAAASRQRANLERGQKVPMKPKK